MSPVRFEDLPVKVRRRLETGGDVAARTPARDATPAAPADPAAPKALGWRCHQCAARFTDWTPAQRHAHTSRHPRTEWVAAR